MNGLELSGLEIGSSPCGCQGAGGRKAGTKPACPSKIHSSDPQSPSPDRTGLPSGDQSAVEPPGPIPNPEVKRRSANGSETIGLVRVGRRQVYARLQVINHLEPGSFFARHRSGGSELASVPTCSSRPPNSKWMPPIHNQDAGQGSVRADRPAARERCSATRSSPISSPSSGASCC